MNMKKILCLLLVVALIACGALAFVKNNENTALKAQLNESNEEIAALKAAAEEAQEDDSSEQIAALESELAAAQLKIETLESAEADADLQSLIDLYKPYYDAQIVVEYDGGSIMLPEVMEEYEYYESVYAQYGIDLASYGMDTQFKQTAAMTLMDSVAIYTKAAELGLDQIDDATMDALTAEAAANYESYIDAVKSNFESEEATEDEVREQSIAYLESLGYSEQAILDSMIENHIQDLMYNYAIEDVEVTDEDLQASYDALVAEQETSYTDDYSYNSARNNGELIAWNPAGYRAVKHVLIMFTDEQSESYSELSSTLDSLNAELEAAQTASEETEGAEDGEDAEEIRSIEEIEGDIASIQESIDALYAELMPTAEEVIAKFNDGTAFEDLIAEYNEDPGMTSEPTATYGYAVAETSTIWDPAFTAGAMSIESVGGISEPVLGQYGIHVIFYDSDIAAGAVAMEEIADELYETALDEKIAETYNAAIDAWVAALNPVYHYENLEN